jgi:signal transduction histidine kinase
MLNNVLDNAEKYGLAGQTITVGLATAPSLVRLWIEDEGPGIPEALRDRVWEPFVRLPRDVQSAVAGSGIGLFVVKELASAQGATVSVDSAPSGGARFIFAFPAARATAARLELLEGSRVST